MNGSVPGADSDAVVEPPARPYAVTMGRSAPRKSLDLLTLVHTTAAGKEALGRKEVHSPESRDIATLCGGIRSLAEISVRLKLPLVVVRAMIEDLHRQGLVSVRPERESQRPSVELLERVLDGLVRG